MAVRSIFSKSSSEGPKTFAEASIELRSRQSGGQKLSRGGGMVSVEGEQSVNGEV